MGVVSEIDSAVSLYSRLLKFWHTKRRSHGQTVAQRFIQLFEAHDIPRALIPQVFKGDLSIADIESESLLVQKLDHKILTKAAKIFEVRVEWLYLSDSQPYEVFHFYKDVEGFEKLLIDLSEKSDRAKLFAHFYLSSHKSGYNSVIVLEDQVGWLRDTPISKYYICPMNDRRYWRAQGQLAAMVALLDKYGFYIKSRWLKGSLEKLSEGLLLPNQFNELKLDKKAYKNFPHTWHPDHWLFNIDDFLANVGEGDFGKINAIGEWLRYEKLGLLNNNYHHKPLPVKEFEKRFKELGGNPKYLEKIKGEVQVSRRWSGRK
jgi:hypothetical protein